MNRVPLSRWMLLIAIMVGVGCVRVAQQTALVMEGYQVGDLLRQLCAQQGEWLWARAQMVGLQAPARLAHTMEDRQLKLVAWLRLPPVPSSIGGPGPALRADGPSVRPLMASTNGPERGD